MYTCAFMQHPVSAYPVGACAINERRLVLWNRQGANCASLCFSSSSVPLWSPTQGFYLVILLFHCIPPCNAMQPPEGNIKYPGPSLSSITRSQQWRQERKKGVEKKAHFMFELEQEGIYSWPYSVMTSLINQIHNSWDGKVCGERERVGKVEDKTASSAFFSEEEKKEENTGECVWA